MSDLLHDDEIWVMELLAPLERMEPVELPARASTRPRLLGRPLAVAACVVAALVLATGIAVAADVNPFSGIAAFAGIGAVDRPQTAEDALSPLAAATMERIAAVQRSLLEHDQGELAQSLDVVPDSARLVGELPGGHEVYVVATTRGLLCVATHKGIGCGHPPGTNGRPGTLAQSYLGASWGIASDGVTAVSFMAEGREQTVQVVDNFWLYEEENSATESITFHFDDGSTHTTTHFRRADGTTGTTITTTP